jgi:N-acetylglucosaminyldiphosphoundecaprenol N-acetyl-beta-D-mannosaminyltransferase
MLLDAWVSSRMEDVTKFDRAAANPPVAVCRRPSPFTGKQRNGCRFTLLSLCHCPSRHCAYRAGNGKQILNGMNLGKAKQKPPQTVRGGARERRDVERRIASYAPHPDERRMRGDRRRNPFRRWRRVRLGDLPVVVVDQATTVRVIVAHSMYRRGLWRFPAFLTSTNGQVTHVCAFDRAIRSMFLQSDAIHADGMPHVFASRMLCKVGLPERVATTDLFYAVNREAELCGATVYMLGATEQVNARAAALVTEKFPALRLLGRHHGYLDSAEAERKVVDEISRLGPDILWVSMGVPHEQSFVVRNRARLTSVGVIKTSGGLFDVVSGAKSRAPGWMQRAGLEWLYRLMTEPHYVGWRYLKTSPSALYLLLTRSN